MLRAAHQVLDHPRVFDDPLAGRIIGPAAEAVLRAAPARFRGSRFLRAFIALRSRYAEDQLARSVERRTRQYVILGAGLDTFPYRNPFAEKGLAVFEVDHPATQSWKRERLREAGIAIPAGLTFAPVDFEKQTLGEGLRRAGFKTAEPAFFSWLGVAVYLTKAAVMETLKFVAALSPGSEIVFDYGVPSSALGEKDRLGREARGRHVASIGEPWLTYFDPVSLAGDLRRMGFRLVEDFGPKEANERYFKGRTDGLYIRGSGRLMTARV